MKKLTRRDLAAIATGAALALQKPAMAQTQSAPDLESQARASKRAAAQSLAQVQLPVATEPAFHFKA
jgi:hypothetical protein